MHKHRILIIFASVFGGLVFLLIAVGPPLYVYLYGFAGIEPSSIDGEEEAKRKGAIWKAENAERKKTIQELGLNSRYTVHPFFDGWKNSLYEHRDFEAVESRLAAEFARSTDPYQAYLYSLYIDKMTELLYVDDPAKMLSVLDDWVNSRPKSYYARLVRGCFHVRLSWYYRGDSHISKVSWKSREKFENHCLLARRDLHAAHALNDRDAEVFVALLEIAYVLGDDRGQIEFLYRKAIALQPFSFFARIMRFRAALPIWGGSWEELDTVLAETEPLIEEFPLLGLVKVRAEAQMAKRSAAHKEALEGAERNLKWAAPYVAQLQHNPDEPLLMVHAAWYLTEGQDYSRAERLYRKLGDNHYESPLGDYRDVLSYNQSRGTAYAAVANQRLGKSDGRRRAEEALAIAPNIAYTNHIFGLALYEDGDFEGAIPYLEKATQLAPDFWWAHRLLAEIDEKLGRKEEALRRSRQLLKEDLEPALRKHVEALVARNA